MRNRKKLSTLALVCVFGWAVAVLVQPAAAKPAPGIAWEEIKDGQMEAAFAKAAAQRRPVFLYWGAVWCPPCNQVKATVFSRRDFIERSKQFVPVYLDGDSAGAQRLGAQYKVRGYPTMILLKPNGTEIMRLPGEVDPQRYMQALSVGLQTGAPVGELLQSALKPGARLSTAQWQQLSLYSWETDEAQLLPAKARAESLIKLALAVPKNEANRPAAVRLSVKALAAAHEEKKTAPAGLAAQLEPLLTSQEFARANPDLLLYNGPEVIKVAGTTPEQITVLAQRWVAQLVMLSNSPSLTISDRLGAVDAQVEMAKSLAPNSASPLPPALVIRAKEAALAAAKATTDKYERQAVIPSAADLLAKVGLISESDAMLQAELPRSVAPYYHMLGLAANAKKRSDNKAAIEWSQKAWEGAQGPATRLQWGASYLRNLIDLAPQESAKIEETATKIIGELEPKPDTFYERNARALTRIANKLGDWNKMGEHNDTMRRLQGQLSAVCKKLPAADPGRTACEGGLAPSKVAEG